MVEGSDGSEATWTVTRRQLSKAASILMSRSKVKRPRSALTWRPWAPLIGVTTGCVVGAWFGLYDVNRILAAAWVGLPASVWPGLDLSFGPAFWSILPAFTRPFSPTI